jgi:hypothetical protein
VRRARLQHQPTEHSRRDLATTMVSVSVILFGGMAMCLGSAAHTQKGAVTLTGGMMGLCMGLCTLTGSTLATMPISTASQPGSATPHTQTTDTTTTTTSTTTHTGSTTMTTASTTSFTGSSSAIFSYDSQCAGVTPCLKNPHCASCLSAVNESAGVSHTFVAPPSFANSATRL